MDTEYLGEKLTGYGIQSDLIQRTPSGPRIVPVIAGVISSQISSVGDLTLPVSIIASVRYSGVSI